MFGHEVFGHSCAGGLEIFKCNKGQTDSGMPSCFQLTYTHIHTSQLFIEWGSEFSPDALGHPIIFLYTNIRFRHEQQNAFDPVCRVSVATVKSVAAERFPWRKSSSFSHIIGPQTTSLRSVPLLSSQLRFDLVTSLHVSIQRWNPENEHQLDEHLTKTEELQLLETLWGGLVEAHARGERNNANNIWLAGAG
jgi:hypothetical protein